jgi:hypothetical protein
VIQVRPEASANWNFLKLAVGATLLAVLAGCAVAMPLRPLTMASQDRRDRDLGCAASSECPNATTRHRRTSRPSQTVAGGNIAEHDPPDFILNNPEGMLR